MGKYTYFSAFPKTKLAFNPDIGQDVQLPTANPATQYLPNIVDNQCGDPIKNSLVDKSPEVFSTARSGDYPSASSLLRSTPSTSKSLGQVTTPPPATEYSSEKVPEAGKTKEFFPRDDSTTGYDSRPSIDTRMIGRDKTLRNAPGLLNKSPKDSYYRQVLNAL